MERVIRNGTGRYVWERSRGRVDAMDLAATGSSSHLVSPGDVITSDLGYMR